MKPFKFLAKLMLGLVSVLFFSNTIAQATGLPMDSTAKTMGALSLFVPGNGLMSSVVVPNAKHIGPFTRDRMKSILLGMDFFKDNRVIRNASRKGTLIPDLEIAQGTRPLDKLVNSRSGTQRTLRGQILKVYDGMKIVNYAPADFREAFLNDMLDGKLQKTMPEWQWFWSAEIEALAAELNQNFYLSTYQANAAAWDALATYTAGQYVNFNTDIFICVSNTSAGESPTTHPAKWGLRNHLVQYNGWGTLIAAYITDSTIPAANIVQAGAITTSNAVEEIEEGYKALPVAVQMAGGVVKVSPDVYQKYLTREKAVYPYALDQSMGDGKKYIYGSAKRWEIKECSWMGNSQRVIYDVRNSQLVVGTNMIGTSDDYAPHVTDPVIGLHDATYAMKYLLGGEIAQPRHFYCGDQA